MIVIYLNGRARPSSPDGRAWLVVGGRARLRSHCRALLGFALTVWTVLVFALPLMILRADRNVVAVSTIEAANINMLHRRECSSATQKT